MGRTWPRSSALMMAGLYIHIPYCHQACTYCDFHFSVNQASRPEMVRMLAAELSRYATWWKNPFGTVYLGGGTPGILHPEEIRFLMDNIRQSVGIDPEAEITLEANPEDVTDANIRAWKDAGFNRISLGVQALEDRTLKWMNRSHTASQALQALESLSIAGFSNLNADLIYGLPDIPAEEYREWIRLFRNGGVTHVSAYALTVEPRTLLARQVHQGSAALPEDAMVSQQFLELRKYLEDAGFQQYELSNFSVPGFESRHNGAYWTGEPYLGLGPSAHSFDGIRRWWNVRSNAKYIDLVSSGSLPMEGEELLTLKDRYNEYIMTGLRTVRGIDVEQASRLSGGAFPELYASELASLVGSGLMLREERRIRLSPEGMMLSDHIISKLFLDEEDEAES